MVRHIPLEPVDELQALLDEAGVEDYPMAHGPHEDSLQGVLAFALFLAERQKRVDFAGFAWDDPRMVSRDARVDITMLYARLDGRTPEAVAVALDEALARPHPPMSMVALDARASGITEFELAHHLYGEVTLFSWPSKPPHPRDPRIEHARERGWARTLKDHNLLPGRGIVVLDDHQGLLLTDPNLEDLVGVAVLLPTNHIVTMLNPFARDDRNEAELQHWLAWGPGTAASEWRVVLDVAREREREDA